ncbi:ParB/Sulfiredoxin [uncultured Caudovirales phage]|uniref:ParB/Sulfiredoxin n=1 Tax=uncultured Caudovirales phage TaxID=2100421 RepID=A0A6J5LI17_9CAUD|nr:ParB/Sulfiredoxin [uncultured Caudovirales phage]CAB4242125.1 ParB/Sulfiredoxin [uncultured Caudovirales phage]
MSQQTIKIQYKKTDSLIPYVNNSRTHSEAQISQIAASIREFGWTNPILLDGQNGIIAGHGRLLAAQKLNEKEVPTIELKDLTEAQKKAYVIADNKLALNAGWDDEVLKLELEGMSDAELALTGFSADELNLLFNGWQSDVDVTQKHGENLDGIGTLIRIQIDPDEETMAREVITNALDNAGVNYELK